MYYLLCSSNYVIQGLPPSVHILRALLSTLHEINKQLLETNFQIRFCGNSIVTLNPDMNDTSFKSIIKSLRINYLRCNVEMITAI